MANVARRLDLIDSAPAFAENAADALNARFEGADTQEMLGAIIPELKTRLAIVSSFGAESAVLLHMVAAVDKEVR